MHVLFAIDSFKGSTSSMQANQAAANGLQKAIPTATYSLLPIADGGEGTIDALVPFLQGEIITLTVTGPLFEPITANYGLVNQGKTAIIEMAQAAGLTLVSKESRNPFLTTTYGVGELIIDAISRGVREFIIGIGGSATNDGGVGMLQALGFGLFDETHTPITPNANGLYKLNTIDTQHANPLLSDCSFFVACDVDNPLCGKHGASAVYGPQKGATDDMIPQLDTLLNHFAQLTQTIYPNANPALPGAGAAGGLGFALATFLNAKLESGIACLNHFLPIEETIQNADILVTGEGCIDFQTAHGKGPMSLAKLAKKHHKTVFAIAGTIGKNASLCLEQGFDAYFPIIQSPISLTKAMGTELTLENITRTCEQLFRVYQVSQFASQ